MAGSGSLTKVGSGVLTLAGINTYTGNTLISGGTLALGNIKALENSTVDTSGGGMLSFGTLTSAAFGGLQGSAGTLTLNNAATTPAPVSLSVGGNGISTTFSGMLAGSGSLTKVGTGRLVLSGSNDYTGGTIVSDGTLYVTNSEALGDETSLTIGTDGTLIFAASPPNAPMVATQSLAVPPATKSSRRSRSREPWGCWA